MGYEHEVIIPNEDITFKMFIFEGKNGNYFRDNHWHRAVEIFAVLEGELIFFIGEEKHELHPGEFILVNSYEIHSILAKKKNKAVVLQIPLLTFEKYYSEDQSIIFERSVDKLDQELMHMIDEMYQIYENKEMGYEMLVHSLFYKLIYFLVSIYRKSISDAETQMHSYRMDKLEKITAYMNKHYNRNLTLDKVAETFGYSPAYLSRMFQKYANLNFKAYLDGIRLEHAFSELASTKIPIGEIAEKNGFANSKAFAKIFKRKYGMLPSEFRRNESR